MPDDLRLWQGPARLGGAVQGKAFEMNDTLLLVSATLPFFAVARWFGRPGTRVPAGALLLWRVGAALQRWATRYAHEHDLMMEDD